MFRSAKTHTVSAASEPGAPAFVAVAVLPTTKPYSPELFAKAVPELDRTAEQLAGLQKGTVESRATIPVLGERVRQYVIAFEKDGTQLRQRVTFFLRGRLNYELACQWKASDSEPPACSQLTETFRLI